MAKKYVYFFGNGKAEGKADMKNLLGGKGANLAEMTNIGVPVPAGFTITTEACTEYYTVGGHWPAGLDKQVEAGMAQLEKAMKRTFGDSKNPLLVSVRSGARVSMPGMMDTVLNLGLNDDTVMGLVEQGGDLRFAYDSYRRFIQMYGDVVLGVEHHDFEHILQQKKDARGVKQDTGLTADDLKAVVAEYKALVKRVTGKDFPETPRAQLEGAINAVFGSWNGDRAVAYRKINKIPGDWGTAVNVQSMVFGNWGEDSATGVAFTRDPSTGEKRFYGEYLINAQGEDVVAGIRTPQPITVAQKKEMDSNLPAMEDEMPELYGQLVEVYQKLEKHYRDMQDLEFTIQQGQLFLLQTRTGKRTGAAAVRIAVEMANEKLITKEQALMRVAPDQLDQLLHPMIDPKEKVDVVAKGLPASPGAVSGQIVFTADEAVERAAAGKAVILVRLETSPEDISGMNAAKGILTARGGMTSHAAVVGRGMGKTCVVGCGAITVDYVHKRFTVGERVFSEGDWVTIDGSTGRVIAGKVKTVDAQLDKNYDTLMTWADESRKLQVWTNADTPADAHKARRFGAQGIGLCRTEHMFFEEDRLPTVKRMIMNIKNADIRRECLGELLGIQRKDFYGILEAMEGLPVTIRLLDPPLHEFMPKAIEIEKELTHLKALGQNQSRQHELEEELKLVEALEELNPMLGHRGCRLGISYPDLYDMQVQAIMEAACELTKQGKKVYPEIMIPLIGTAEELKVTRTSAEKVIAEVFARTGIKVPHHIGTMIEIPRAALTSAMIAPHADFYSFGTNDLTQMTFGYSRDDVGKFVPEYIEKGILPGDPFVSIDQTGVGRLMQLCVDEGRAVNPKLKIGICGEHGGEDASVKFCHKVGLNYVSCSPYRVPIARLAAAQAAILDRMPGAPKKAVAAPKAAPAPKKAPAKQAAAPKKAAPKKAAPKKAAAKKAPAKKQPAPKKAPAKKAVAKKAPAKKKPAPKKPVAKKAPAKKPVKKAVAKKAPAKKQPAPKKAAPKKTKKSR